MKKRLLLSFMALLTASGMWAADGDTFTANTIEGVEMTFKVISEANKTCQVGNGSKAAIYWSTSGTITVPQSVNGYNVTSIGNSAFISCTVVKSIVIPNGISSIGRLAFYQCFGLQSINIPIGVTALDDATFYCCTDLKSITIPEGVTTIGREAFAKSGLTSITIPNGVTKISDEAFSGCTDLTNVSISQTVTTIGKYVFQNCNSLTNITIPPSVNSLDNVAFCGCNNLTSIIVDPENTKYDSRNECNAVIETATNKLIIGCKNTVIPNSVIEIDHAFYGCSGLTNISIPEGVTKIGKDAFYRCSNLSSIYIPTSVTTIGYSAFSGCTKLATVTISEGVNMIDYEAFTGCTNLTEITIPSSIKYISLRAFSGCSSLVNIEVNSGNTKFDSRDGCNAIIETTTNKLIVGCKNTVIPNSVTEIGTESFLGCSGLTTITIPEGVKKINSTAFKGCTNLTTVVIPYTVTGIGTNAFQNCSSLKQLFSYIEAPSALINSFDYSTYGDAVVYVPNGTKTSYESTMGWGDFENIVEMNEVQVTLSKDTITFTNPYPLDFSTPIEGLKAYIVSDVIENKAILTEVTKAVPAVTGLILVGTAGETYTITSATSYPNAITNKLVGVTVDTAIGGNDVDYILSNGKFVKASAGTLAAGKAYLKLDAALARGTIDIVGDVTGIDALLNNKEESIKNNEVYNLNGQRISKPAKGVYVVDGKKVMVK